MITRFSDKIQNIDEKVKGHNLIWDVMYKSNSCGYMSPYDMILVIHIKNNWVKIYLDTNICTLQINEVCFYVETFKFAEEIISSYAHANDYTISEKHYDKKIIRKLKIKNIFGEL
jgi:hypothetical protein